MTLSKIVAKSFELLVGVALRVAQRGVDLVLQAEKLPARVV
jgi:hypothetical protein